MIDTDGQERLPLHGLTLRFKTSAMEAAFTDWIFASRSVQMRLAMLLVAFLYIILGLQDSRFSTGSLIDTAQMLHFFVIIPMLLATVILGSLGSMRRVFFPLAALATTVAASCNLYLVHQTGLQSQYVPELYFMILWAFTVAGFRLWMAVGLAVVMIVAAVVNAATIPQVPMHLLLAYCFWLFVAFSLAYLGGYLLEYYSKANFYNVVELQREIEERRSAQESLRHAAFHDPLTSLPNRVLLGERLKDAIEQAKRKDEKIGWLFIDLDHFKTLNDTLGHSEGDKLLRMVAGRLQSSVRASDTVGRLGGDEFTVLLTGISDIDAALRIAEKIRENLEMPYELGAQGAFVTSASIGVALYPDHGSDETALSKSADSAMYLSKKKGRNTVTVFEP
jgi:diguanylate cyclase (GGDEF)-like protein